VPPNTQSVAYVVSTRHQRVLPLCNFSFLEQSGVTLGTFSQINGGFDDADLYISILCRSRLSIDYAPDFGVLNGPYLLEDPKDFKKLLDSSQYQCMKSTVKKNRNFEVLAMNWVFGERHIISNKAILSPSDLKGFSMRVPPNAMWIETVTRATQLAWSEVYTGLSSGVVDAAEAPVESLYAAKLYKSKKRVSLTSHFKAFIGLVINADYFANLPQYIQTILAEEAIKAGDYMTELSIGTTETLLDKLRSEGVTVHKNVDAKAFQKATAPV
jgi:TRAP-type C4-dicarboxylate transport system substrate-binding protein